MSKVIFSCMFGLHSYVGHIYQYHLSIAKICEINGWKHVGLIPKDCKIENLPNAWEKYLAKGSWDNKNFIQNMASSWRNFLFFKKFLRKRSIDDVIFLEHFSIFNMLSLIFALLFTKPKCKFLLLHRFLFPRYGLKTILYKLLHLLIKKNTKINNLSLLTDSDLLAREQCKLFKQKVDVVPIPHTSYFNVEESKKYLNSIDLWWPGGSTRRDKGIEYINLLSNQIAKSKNIKLLVADSAKSKINNCEQIQFLETSLCSNEYYRLMQCVDLILLPYIPEEYKFRTSGIFVEAVFSGTKVITFKNTWMAYELDKFGLDELSIKPIEFCLDRIIEICSLSLNDRMAAMTNHYRKFHSEKNFAKTLLKMNI